MGDKEFKRVMDKGLKKWKIDDQRWEKYNLRGSFIINDIIYLHDGKNVQFKGKPVKFFVIDDKKSEIWFLDDPKHATSTALSNIKKVRNLMIKTGAPKEYAESPGYIFKGKNKKDLPVQRSIFINLAFVAMNADSQTMIGSKEKNISVIVMILGLKKIKPKPIGDYGFERKRSSDNKGRRGSR